MTIDARNIRVLQDPPLDGPVNMARDEALMIRAGRFESPPTLRLYQWAQPTISLGYFQPFAQYEALARPAGDLPVVRRLTGGGAILHDLELTYSLTLPVAHPLTVGGPNRLYELAHDAIIAAFDELNLRCARCGITDDSGPARGPFFCFERRHDYDVLTGEGKIAGSAQRRTREAILQHGSIVLGNRYAQQVTARVPMAFEDSVQAMRVILVERLAEVTDERFQPGAWADAELVAARALIPKYAGPEWTKRT